MPKKKPSKSAAPKAPAAPKKKRASVREPGVDLRRIEEVVTLAPRLPGGRDPKAKGLEAIRQNAILRRMQDFWNKLSVTKKEQKLRELMALRELQGEAQAIAFVKMGEKDGTLRGDADLAHAANEWLGSYFKGPVVEILIEGMIVAAQRSLASGLPTAMYWVAGAGKRMQISVAESAHQVTFLLMTPPQPRTKTPVRELDKPESLWVVSGQGKKTVVVEQVYPTALV